MSSVLLQASVMLLLQCRHLREPGFKKGFSKHSLGVKRGLLRAQL